MHERGSLCEWKLRKLHEQRSVRKRRSVRWGELHELQSQ